MFYVLPHHLLQVTLQCGTISRSQPTWRLSDLRPRWQSSQIDGQSKPEQLFWTPERTRKLAENSNVCVTKHPGIVDAELIKNNLFVPKILEWLILLFWNNAMWTAVECAFTMLYLAAAADHVLEKSIRERYFHPQAHERLNPKALDEILQQKVWALLDDLGKCYVWRYYRLSIKAVLANIWSDTSTEQRALGVDST